jgi:hypothetical protein
MIKLYLTHGASVHEDGNTSLLLAMKSNYRISFREMLARGADMMQVPKTTETHRCTGPPCGLTTMTMNWPNLCWSMVLSSMQPIQTGEHRSTGHSNLILIVAFSCSEFCWRVEPITCFRTTDLVLCSARSPPSSVERLWSRSYSSMVPI